MSTNENRTKIWAYVKHKKLFTYKDIVNQTGINYSTVRSFIQTLIKQNIAKIKVEKRGSKPVVFELVGEDPPKFGSGAKVGYRRKKWKKLNGAAKCWRSMRVLKKFSTADIAQGAEVSDSYSRQYVHALHKAGYMRCLTPHKSGAIREGAVYLLIKDTGPRNPIIRQRDNAVFDPNLNEVFKMEAKSKPNKVVHNRPVGNGGDYVRLD